MRFSVGMGPVRVYPGRSNSGCLTAFGWLIIPPLVVAWPAIFLHGLAAGVVEVIWLAVLAAAGAWYLRRRRNARQRRVEEALRTGALPLHDGRVTAWAGVTPAGVCCHHRHRSPQAASACAASLAQ